MSERKIVQIAACAIPANEHHDQNWGLYALCNDGTLWSLDGGLRWVELDPIPQVPHTSDRATRGES